jgi:hypothetical protein
MTYASDKLVKIHEIMQNKNISMEDINAKSSLAFKTKSGAF